MKDKPSTRNEDSSSWLSKIPARDKQKINDIIEEEKRRNVSTPKIRKGGKQKKEYKPEKIPKLLSSESWNIPEAGSVHSIDYYREVDKEDKKRSDLIFMLDIVEKMKKHIVEFMENKNLSTKAREKLSVVEESMDKLIRTERAALRKNFELDSKNE